MAEKQIRFDACNRIVDAEGRRKKANELTRAEVEALNALHPTRPSQTPATRAANIDAARRRRLYALDRGVVNGHGRTPPRGWTPSADLREKIRNGEEVFA